MIRALMISLWLVACGGTKSEPSTGTDKPMEHHEEHAMSPELAKFHDVLAPRWHAAKGPQRMKDTCAALPEFTAGVTALARAAPPAGTDSTKWTDTTGELAAAIGKLDETCKANDAAAFESAFQNVHESFHAMLGGGEANERDEGHEHAM